MSRVLGTLLAASAVATVVALAVTGAVATLVMGDSSHPWMGESDAVRSELDAMRVELDAALASAAARDAHERAARTAADGDVYCALVTMAARTRPPQALPRLSWKSDVTASDCAARGATAHEGEP